MKWQHPEQPGRRVRLAYCQNFHAADALEATIESLRSITLPLRDRLDSARGSSSASPFGVGLYLPASVALPLAERSGARDLEAFGDFLAENRLDPFTYNAFPYGDFHRAGLKAGVFRPTWEDETRVEFTLAVARIAASVARRAGNLVPPGHVSISTHSGCFGSFEQDDAGRASEMACASNLARVVEELARLESDRGVRIVLALEPEPRANASDQAELAPFLESVWNRGAEHLARSFGRERSAARSLMQRHLGTCLDCCHAAVEFESDAVERWHASGAALGKLQFSSALSILGPGLDPIACEALLALDEPRYLHQVTGRSKDRKLRVDDLPDLRRDLARDSNASSAPSIKSNPPPSDLSTSSSRSSAPRSASSGMTRSADGHRASAADWESCSEWRCHFHVPVDLERVREQEGGERGGAAALATTRSEADRMLAQVLALQGWHPPELHVEIETYTWDVLPGPARGSGSLVDGLEREYAHVMGELERAGWKRE
jgi:hypothetical protein